MKIRLPILGLPLVIAANAAAAANCGPANYVRISDSIGLYGILSQRYVCAERGSDTWRECHGTISGTTCTGSADLWDLKRGAGDPVDPSEKVGEWRISGTDGVDKVVTYDYGTGGAYTYQLWVDLGSTPVRADFCGTSPAPNDVTGATLQLGACP